MTIPIDMHELRERLRVFRTTRVEDGYGGDTEALVEQPLPVAAKVSQPTAAEQVEAAQAGATLGSIVHLRPDANVRRGDILVRPDGDRLRVKYTVHPSEPVYLRADTERIQAEGEAELP